MEVQRLSRQVVPLRRHDAILGVVTVMLFVTLAIDFVIPQGQLILVNADLDNAFNGLVTGIALMASLLQWLRYSEERTAESFLLAFALAVLATGNAVRVVVASTAIGDALGYLPADPGQGPAWAWLAMRATAAVLFALAGTAAAADWRRIPRSIFLLSLLGLVLASAGPVLFFIVGPMLPPLVDPPAAGGPSVTPQATTLFVAANVAIAAIYAFAVVRLRQAYRVTGARRDALLALGMMVMVFGQLHSMIDITAYTGLLAFGDVLRATFYLLVVTASHAEVRATLRELRESHARVVELQDAHITTAISDERARLAREVHDGLTQELWLAKLRAGELGEHLEGSSAEAVAALAGVRSAIDRAMTEARQAIVALDVASRPAADFASDLAAYVNEAGDRLGVAVTVDVRGPMPEVPVRTSGEIIRIVQEALANVRKHARASHAVVAVDASGDRVRVRVEDDGVGIGPDVAGVGHGLESMRQRARSIGATLTVTRRSPDRGTVVELDLANAPVAPSRSA